jgi:hypothetical protein
MYQSSIYNQAHYQAEGLGTKAQNGMAKVR